MAKGSGDRVVVDVEDGDLRIEVVAAEPDMATTGS
jgi:hypothetical protein